MTAKIAQPRKPLAEWLPIETAPKDGTWILVGNVKYDHPFVVKWELYTTCKRWDGSQWVPIDGQWIEDDPGCYGTDLGMWDPTHWMPLPPPP